MSLIGFSGFGADAGCITGPCLTDEGGWVAGRPDLWCPENFFCSDSSQCCPIGGVSPKPNGAPPKPGEPGEPGEPPKILGLHPIVAALGAVGVGMFVYRMVNR